MGLQWSRRAAFGLYGCLALALAACQGNLGSGSGLSIPQAPGYGQPGGPGPGGGSAAQSRQQLLEGAVYVTPATKDVPLPQVEGFAVTVALGTAPPSPAPGELASAEAETPGGHVKRQASRPASTAPGDPSAAPSAVASAASPAPAASPTSTVSPAAKPSAGAKPSPTAAPVKFDTKTTIYPDDAPVAPTPQPTGEVQTFVKRAAILRGYLLPGQDLTLYGLGAVRFKIPTAEQLPDRGFTVAIFQSGKHHHDKLIDSDTDAKLSDDVVASSRSDVSIELKKNTGYLLLLYADEAAPTPAPVQPGYPTPGNNPFPMPSSNTTPYPGGPGYPGQPTYPPGGPNNPYASPTPFR
jgi:hypothetical protein